MNKLLKSSCFAFRTMAGLFAMSVVALAQFREIGPAPFPPAEAHQKIRLLLDQVDAENRPQTVKMLLGWVDWYRDVLDEEVIATWKGDRRANLAFVIDDLQDARIASEIAGAWRQPGLDRTTAPILAKLMTRYSDSTGPFFGDMLQLPNLSGPEAEVVCRILLDLPERWRSNALRILPHYRNVAQNLLAQDLHDRDEEKVGKAEFWLRDLQWNVPDSGDDAPRRRPAVAPMTRSDPSYPPPTQGRPTLARPDPGNAPPLQSPMPLSSRPVPMATQPRAYAGAQSGTLTCSGAVPQNAEYVFRNLPPGDLKLDYDTKNWNARLLAADGGTQRLILTNISSGPQKKCVVQWSVAH